MADKEMGEFWCLVRDESSAEPDPTAEEIQREGEVHAFQIRGQREDGWLWLLHDLVDIMKDMAAQEYTSKTLSWGNKVWVLMDGEIRLYAVDSWVEFSCSVSRMENEE